MVSETRVLSLSYGYDWKSKSISVVCSARLCWSTNKFSDRCAVFERLVLFFQNIAAVVRQYNSQYQPIEKAEK